jgi:N-acetylglutamate synthase
MRDVLESCDVGHRVVVRRRAGTGGHGRPLYTDLLGDLVAINDQRLTLRADDGTEHSVELTEVAAGKRIPPRPVRYSEMAALERIADDAWPAPEHERLGDWFLRSAAGFTNRANSALPLGDPGCHLDEAIDACAEWYLTRSLPPKITVPLPLRRDVAAALSRRGWHAQPPVLVQTALLADVLAVPRSKTGPVPSPETKPPALIRLQRTPSTGFLRIIMARKAGLPEAAHRVLHGVGEVRFAEVPESTGVADAAMPRAIARAAMVGEWMHLGLVEVVESARRLGLARALTQALASWASSAGAVRALLQVEEHNTAAVGLYASMGFHTHHTYITYRAPDVT